MMIENEGSRIAIISLNIHSQKYPRIICSLLYYVFSNCQCKLDMDRHL